MVCALCMTFVFGGNIDQYYPKGWYLLIYSLGRVLTNTIPRDSIDQYCPDAGDVPENNWGVMVTALNQIPPCRGEPSSLKDKSRNSCKRQRKGILLNFSLFIFRLTVLFLTFKSQ